MNQVRHVYLDRRTARLYEIRTAAAKLVKEEKEELRLSLRYMHDKNVKSYQQNGVELEKVAGEEKLRCRLTKETASEMLPIEGGPESPNANVDESDTINEANASEAAAESGRLEP